MPIGTTIIYFRAATYVLNLDRAVLIGTYIRYRYFSFL